MFSIEQALQKLDQIQQSHLLYFWDRLNTDQKNYLLQQIQQLDVDRFLEQQRLVHQKKSDFSDVEPIEDDQLSGSSCLRKIGRQQISSGKAGCLLVAGGQGTRLNHDGPKGMLPITKNGKTLFQIFAEKILAANRSSQHAIPFAVMTSPAAHEQIQHFFREQTYFGLPSDQVFFFSQNTLPFLSPNGSLFLDRMDRIAVGPSGNGDALFGFYESNTWEIWNRMGIESLVFVQVDNPLANPLDPELIGALKEMGSDVSAQAIFRENPEEKVGIFVKEKGKIVVKEYSEISHEEQFSLLSDGTLKHKLANISHFCFNMGWIKEIYSDQKKELPLHPALKKVDYLDHEGEIVKANQPNAWKFERFIFDLLPYSKKTEIIVSERKYCFAPIKTQSDLDRVKRLDLELSSNY